MICPFEISRPIITVSHTLVTKYTSVKIVMSNIMKNLLCYSQNKYIAIFLADWAILYFQGPVWLDSCPPRLFQGSSHADQVPVANRPDGGK